VLDLLIMAGIRRYANLAEQWGRTLRPTLLNHPHLANKKALREFTHELLWDSWPSLSEHCVTACRRSGPSSRVCGALAATLRCSWRAGGAAPGHRRLQALREVRARGGTRPLWTAWAFRTAPDGASVLAGRRALSRPLVQGGEDFGLFQGLVWELRLPLRRDVLTQARAGRRNAFLDKADLMDFPGVSNEHEGAKKITDDVLAADLVRGLTEVLKRGKTASIAVSRAAELDIDGFSILARAGKAPRAAEAARLRHSELDACLRPESGHPQGRVMPLNLVITFCAKLVNDVCSSGIRNGLDSYFSLFSEAG
jgi:hypothetical protein